MHAFDVAVIDVYMAALVATGARAARRQNTTDQYFLAERSIPGWAIGMSLLATIITSITFIAYPGAAYAGDWSLFIPGIMFVAVIAGIGVVVVPFFRHVVTISVYEYFGKRFGNIVRSLSSLAFATGHFAKMGFVFYLLALSVGGITGGNLTYIILILGAITIFYTLIDGMEAVIWTDVLQGLRAVDRCGGFDRTTALLP
jgi:SSS family solute:Na+ symporter